MGEDFGSFLTSDDEVVPSAPAVKKPRSKADAKFVAAAKSSAHVAADKSAADTAYDCFETSDEEVQPLGATGGDAATRAPAVAAVIRKRPAACQPDIKKRPAANHLCAEREARPVEGSAGRADADVLLGSGTTHHAPAAHQAVAQQAAQPAQGAAQRADGACEGSYPS